MSNREDLEGKFVLAVVGVGLLGGSVAMAARQFGVVQHVVGIGRDVARLQAAVDLGIIDEFSTEPTEANACWDMVVVATPVDRIATDVRKMARISLPGPIITDVGSVKADICESIGAEPAPGVFFVGSHPMAGSEKRGFETARGDLFIDRVVVVTPDKRTETEALDLVTEFWTLIGSRVVSKPADQHDEAVATTSHVPHVAASALAALLWEDQHDLAANGFRDTTRIAAGDPDLWTTILKSNAEAVLPSLRSFIESLEMFEEALENGDGKQLKKLLALGKTSRDALDREPCAAPLEDEVEVSPNDEIDELEPNELNADESSDIGDADSVLETAECNETTREASQKS